MILYLVKVVLARFPKAHSSIALTRFDRAKGQVWRRGGWVARPGLSSIGHRQNRRKLRRTRGPDLGASGANTGAAEAMTREGGRLPIPRFVKFWRCGLRCERG
jgi:hypothetical protein